MQTDEKNKNEQNPDFVDLYRRYSALDNGLKAALRRVETPEDIRDTAILYRMFHDARPHDRWLRVMFLLPWCEQCKAGWEDKTKSFGALLAEAHVNENRLFQMARAKEPLDLVLLRRLAIQIKPVLNWEKLGWTLFCWDSKVKREDIVEDYFYNSSKKAQKGA